MINVDVIAINHLSEREVITCYHCKLVQFRTANDLCRRCHKPPPQIASPAVWKAQGISIGEMLKFKGIERPDLMCD